MEINNIFRKYIVDEVLLIYSIDESILKITKSIHLLQNQEQEATLNAQAARVFIEIFNLKMDDVLVQTGKSFIRRHTKSTFRLFPINFK